MLRKVSCWPANEASGRSSAVAEERTAKLLPDSETSNQACCISEIKFCGRGVFRIRPLIFFPARLKSLRFSIFKFANSFEITLSILLLDINSLNAEDVIAKPPGTLMPNFVRLFNISPRDEFLPPTASKSCIEISLRFLIKVLAILSI